MEPLTLAGVFSWALWVAIEELLENATDAAWTGATGQLKVRFLRWAGKDKESQRRAAFTRSTEVARTNTLLYAADPHQAERILDVLNSERDRRGAEALAEEAAKLMLFSAAPDVPRLTDLCHRTLRFGALFAEETPPPPETVATVLSDFLTNLRESMLDQEPYHDLIEREMLRALREVVTELRPVAYDDEATYRYQVAEMYRQLEFVGIPKLKERRPITVEDIFIRLRAEREAGVWESRHILAGERWAEAIKQAMREASETRMVKERVEVDDALRETKHLVFLGDPGAGKTTLLKYLTVICAEGRDQAELGLRADGARSPLPVFVPLREFAAECAGRDQDYCLLDYLYTHARECLMLNLARGFFEDALEAGHCLVCLDGLDEVWAVGQRKVVRDAVKALATRFPRSRYVVTSRIVGYEESPLDRRNFTHYTILPLEDDDIREFVCRWYEVRERDPVQRKRKADDLIATIEREPRIKSLAVNPLLLTIIALVHRIEAELPHERVKLYDKCVTALVDTWEEVKRLTISEKQRPFYRYRRRLLERLAYELHTQAEEPGQVQTVKGGDLELLITRFLMENRRLGFADDPDGAREEARAFIRLARGRTGLLVERGAGVFGFPHLTFQEYLAACDIENRCIHRGVDAIWEEIQDCLHDSHWREVILLLLGSLSKYDEPPTLLVERILEAGEGDKFEPILHRHLYLATRALADRVDVEIDLHQRIVDALVTVLHPASPLERFDAFSTLGDLKQDEYTIRRMLDLIAEPEVHIFVRRGAARTLGRIAPPSGQVIDMLLALAHGPKTDAWLRCDIAEALGLLGQVEEAADLLLALAQAAEGELDFIGYIALSLSRLGRLEQAEGLLRPLVHDSQVDTSARRSAAHELSWLGYEEESFRLLMTLASNPQVSLETRCEVAWSLAETGHAEEAEALLSDLATDGEAGHPARYSVANTLVRVGYVQKAIPILQELAADPTVPNSVRCDVVSDLADLGQLDRAMSCLVDLVSNQHEELLQEWPIQSVSEVGEQAVIFLQDVATDKTFTENLRHAALKTLIALDRSEKTTDVLLTVDKDAEVAFWIRNTTYEILKRIVGM